MNVARTSAIALLIVTLTACAAPADKKDVATAGGQPKTSNSSAKKENLTEKLRKYAKCMRDNGVDMPDPGANGAIPAIPAEGGTGTGVVGGPGSKEQKAFEKCRQYEPQGDDLPKPKPEELERMRKYAKCMRDNGMAQFPDPDTGGGITIGKGGTIDLADPAYKKASKACEKLMGPGGAPIGLGTTTE